MKEICAVIDRAYSQPCASFHHVIPAFLRIRLGVFLSFGAYYNQNITQSTILPAQPGGTMDSNHSNDPSDTGPVSLKDIIVTDELSRRPSRLPEYEAESRAM